MILFCGVWSILLIDLLLICYSITPEACYVQPCLLMVCFTDSFFFLLWVLWRVQLVPSQSLYCATVAFVPGFLHLLTSLMLENDSDWMGEWVFCTDVRNIMYSRSVKIENFFHFLNKNLTLFQLLWNCVGHVGVLDCRFLNLCLCDWMLI